MRAKRRGRGGLEVFGLGLGLGLGLVACGARTGLRLPDVANANDATVRDVARVDVPGAMDALDASDVADAADALDASDAVDLVFPDVCVVQRIPVRPLGADVLLVIDRSTSMGWDLRGGTGTPSRWTLLRDALRTTLPTYETVLDMGLHFFPDPRTGASCGVSSSLDVAIGPRNAGAINMRLAATSPGGTTPTHDGLRAAYNVLSMRPSLGRTRSLVLATDGAPNCNADLDSATCFCTQVGNPNPPACSGNPLLCRDDGRTRAALSEFYAAGIPTYVIGIDEDGRTDLVDVLNRLADAGGRPNTAPGGQRYYSVRRREDLVSAFERVQGQIAACVLVATSVPTDPDGMLLEVGGEPAPRDRSRREGWDWTDLGAGEVTLFGSWCERVLRAETGVIGVVPCPPSEP